MGYEWGLECNITFDLWPTGEKPIVYGVASFKKEYYIWQAIMMVKF